MPLFVRLTSRAAILSAACCLLLAGPLAQAQGPVALVPLPTHLVQTGGSADSSALLIDGGLQVSIEGVTEPRLDRARDRFLAQLSRETGILQWPAPTASQPRLLIRTARPSAPVQQLGEDESYHLEVNATGILLSAPTPLGTLHGLQTLLQLITLTGRGFVLPAVTIDDQPRFPWRGLMIDTGRHFIPLDVLRQNLDLMEAAKLNVFHWHLSDDQGFRVESKVYPLLQAKGSDGLYYTQQQVRELIGYARDRGIRVIPEFDMPGHATSWFVGYPELASGAGPYAIVRKWGVFDPAMDPSRESTFAFLDRFFAEMTALFPDAYFHVGGDECNGKEWDANPRIQQFMRAHQLKDDAALQAYFTGRAQKLVTKYHKITIGWDEVLQPDTPRDVVIQSWRGQDSLAVAARQGNRGILSWGYYLDLNQPASQHYAVDPLGGKAAELGADQQKLVLGGEAAMWSEYMSPEIITGRIWPRAAAVAERLWSPAGTVDEASMYARLAVLSQHLPWYGVPYGLPPEGINVAMLQRMVGMTAVPGLDAPDGTAFQSRMAALLVLARVVEPPKEYAREELRAYTSYTPLNRLVDAVPPESEQGRQFRGLAALLASGKGSPAEFALARQWLTLWRDNDHSLQPWLAGSALTAELAPLSLNLSHAASLGLEALSSLETRTATPPSAAQQARLAELKKLEAPQAVLLDSILPGVAILVRGTGH